MFLVDNDIISHLRKFKDASRIKQWIYGLPDDEVRLAHVTVFEQLRGIEMAEITNPLLAAQLRLWWQGFQAALPADAIVWPDGRALEVQAKLFSEPALKSFLIPHGKSGDPKFKTGGDLTLAATAVAYGIPIATLNVEDFKEINDVVPLPGVFCPNTSRWVVPRAEADVERSMHREDTRTIGEALKRVLWLPPFSSAVAEAQSDVLVEFLDRLCAEAGMVPDGDVRARLVGSTDRGALKRLVRELAGRMDASLARTMVEHMQEVLGETSDPAPSP